MASSWYIREDCDIYNGECGERYDEIAVFLLPVISLIKRYPEILYTFVIGGHTTKYKISRFLFVENHMVDIIQRFP